MKLETGKSRSAMRWWLTSLVLTVHAIASRGESDSNRPMGQEAPVGISPELLGLITPDHSIARAMRLDTNVSRMD